MSPTFTDDDIGKTVESAEGEALGVIVDIDAETAYIEPESDITDSTKAVLNWEGSSENTVPVADTAVSRITDDSVRLESAFQKESIQTGPTGGDTTPGQRAGRSERQDTEYTPGEPVESSGIEPETDTAGADRKLGTGEPGDASEGRPGMDPARETNETEEQRGAEEMESVETAASRELDVDPTELTDDDPNADIQPEEDVGQRTHGPGEDVATGSPTTEDGGPIPPEENPETERQTDTEEDEDHDEQTAADDQNLETDR